MCKINVIKLSSVTILKRENIVAWNNMRTRTTKHAKLNKEENFTNTNDLQSWKEYAESVCLKSDYSIHCAARGAFIAIRERNSILSLRSEFHKNQKINTYKRVDKKQIRLDHRVNSWMLRQISHAHFLKE